MSTAGKAHGLDGSLVEPDWPPLTVAEVSSLLRNFPGRRGPVEILSISPRPFSAASLVATHGGHVFIKRHHRSVRDREGLLEEHRFMAHLLTQGLSVPRVIPADSGETAIESGAWTYEVHEIPPGVDLYEDAISWTPFLSVKHAHSAGRALAKLHLSARGFSAAPRKPRPLVASFSIFADSSPHLAFERYLAARPALAHDVDTRRNFESALALLAPFHAELLPSLPALTPLWTHNDLHASNLFWSDRSDDAQGVAIIDFGLADRTNAIYDLAHAIERNIVEWLALVDAQANGEDVPVHLDHLLALLKGYELVRPLSLEEAAALAPMTALCHAEFALTETDYFLSVLHSEEKARVASDDYLVGHARWFRGAGGSKLLDALHKWADAREQKSHGVLKV
ncbi:MAG: phosphotransferase [Terracidiphilus sp.]